MPHRPSALSALAGLLLTSGLLVTAAPPASAATAVNESYVPASDGSFAIEGHGWGHGHGMGQWSAQGAATLGVSADEITAFSYPGTAKATIATTPMRVLLQADNDADTQVYPASGLTFTDRASGASARVPTGPDRWRVLTDGTGLHVQSLSGTTWTTYSLRGRTTLTGPVDLTGSTFQRVVFPNGSSRDYRGSIRAQRVSATAVRTINTLSMEDYLRGVVPREASSGWEPAALQAQSIAARSYSAYKRSHAPTSQPYDICDTTQCQVYGGAAIWSGTTRTSLEPASTDQAIAATAGVVRTYQGGPIFAEFSSSNGGWSTDGGVAYLKAQQDDWDGVAPNSVHSWTARLTAAQLQARYPAVGTLQRLRVTERDGNGEWGGRVTKVLLEGVDSAGKATSVATTGAGVYNANSWPARSDGLRSSWWHVASDTSSAVVSQTPAPTLVKTPGISTATITATVRNNGKTTWSTSGLHLAVSSPPGQADPLVGGSTTPGRYTGTAGSVAPGDEATFSFDLTGDGVPVGLQGRTYRLRNGTGPLFGADVSWRVPVQAPVYAASRSGGAAPAAPVDPAADGPGSVWADGRTVVVPVKGETALRLTYVNEGNAAWPAAPSSPFALGTSSPRNRRSASAGPEWGSNGYRPARLTATEPIEPKGTATFDVTLHGNDLPLGVSTEAFEPVWERRGWPDGALTTLSVIRVDPATARVAETVRPPRATLNQTNGPGQVGVLVIRLRNLGGEAWTVGTDRLLASTAAFATDGWDGARTPTLARGLSRAGQSRVYPGEIGEWRVPVSTSRARPGTTDLGLQAVTGSGSVYGPRFTTTVKVTQATASASLVRTGPAVRMSTGGRVNAWFDARNTGSVAWELGGAVRSLALTPHGSPSVDRSWISPSRPAAVRANVSRPGTPVVRPGEIGRFVVTLAGNGRPAGAYSEQFGLLWEGWRRMPTAIAELPYTIA